MSLDKRARLGGVGPQRGKRNENEGFNSSALRRDIEVLVPTEHSRSGLYGARRLAEWMESRPVSQWPRDEVVIDNHSRQDQQGDDGDLGSVMNGANSGCLSLIMDNGQKSDDR